MAERNFKATISVGAKLASSFNSTFGGAEAKAKELSATVKRLNQTQKTGQEFMRQTGEVDAARAALKREMEALAAYQKWARETNAGDDGKRTVEEYTGRVNKAREALAKKQSRLEAMRTELRAAGLDTSKMSDEIERVAREAALAEAKIKALGQTRGAVAALGAEFGKLKERATTAGIALGAVGFAAWKAAAGMANMGDDASETAAALGTTSQSLQALRYAGERVGVASEKVDGALNKLNQTIEEARGGSEKAGAAFEELGLDAETLAALPLDERMATIAEAFKNYRGSANKSALATDLFGSKAYKMANVLNLGAAGLKKLREEGEKTGFILDEKQIALADEFDSAFGRFKATMIGIRNEIGTALLPVINKFLTFATEHTTLLKVAVLGFATALTATAAIAVARFGMQLWTTVKAIDAVIVKFLALRALEGGGIAGTIGKLGGEAAGAVPGLMAFAGRAIPALIGGFKALSVAIMTVPGIGWIAAGITALAWVVWKYWEPIKAFLGGVWDGFLDGFREVWAGLQPLIKPLADAFAPVLWVFRKIGDLLSWVSSQFRGTSEEMAGFASAGKLVGKAIADALLFPFRAVALAIEGVSKAFGWLKGLLGFGSPAKAAETASTGHRKPSAAPSAPQPVAEAARPRVKAPAARPAKATARPAPALAMGEDGDLPPPGAPDLEDADPAPVGIIEQAAPAPRAAQSNVSVKNENQITINAAAGMNPAEIAREVMRQLDSRERDRQRGALFDAMPSY